LLVPSMDEGDDNRSPQSAECFGKHSLEFCELLIANYGVEHFILHADIYHMRLLRMSQNHSHNFDNHNLFQRYYNDMLLRMCRNNSPRIWVVYIGN
jgi:hypothetical protein